MCQSRYVLKCTKDKKETNMYILKYQNIATLAPVYYIMT